jgi:hypothetical protein
MIVASIAMGFPPRQDVPVFDMRQFVRQNAFEFVVVENLQDAFGCSNGRVLRISTRRKRVR